MSSIISEKLVSAIRLLVFIGAIISCCAIAETIPADFNDAPEALPPLSSGKTYHPGKTISLSSQDSEVDLLHSYIISSENQGIFSLKNSLWSQYGKANIKKNQAWRISKIACSTGINCFLLKLEKGKLLIAAKESKITDFQLINAIQYQVFEAGKSRAPVAQLDTMFGEVGLFPFPETDYEKTGIFCSVLTTTSADGQEKVQIFKRRITPEGKIENKVLPEGVHECKLPW